MLDSAFIDNAISFFGIGLALYTIAQVYSWISHDNIVKHSVKCKYCRKSISEKVRAGTARFDLLWKDCVNGSSRRCAA